MTKKLRMKREETFLVKSGDLNRSWFVLDVAGKTLGRAATEIANILRGKHKPTFSPSIDAGDGVIIVNADKIKVTGSKEAQKVYRHYTGYLGGMRAIPYRTMQARKPGYIIEHAVKGMVPRTKLGRAQMKRLRIFAGPEHTMSAQKPVNANI